MPSSSENTAASTTEAWLDDLDPDDSTLVIDRELTDLRAIGAAIYAIETAEENLVRAVAAAKHAGRSWTQIANVLGVSRQAARQRFSGKVDLAWPQVVDVQLGAEAKDSAGRKRA
ncbi:MAG: hypothetical protein M3Y42_12940 [Actinomycetota bacterium]|nr:hypothetical protein [Actinomycetota bacterium]MDQ2957859.1 hypothetical protein [Actinomycetota bacterium]